MRSLFLNILLGISMICGNCHAGNDSQDGGDSQPTVPAEADQLEDYPWLRQWMSLNDVDCFFDHVEKQRKAGIDVELDIDYSVVNNTVSNNDRWNALCILTNAFYSVDINKLELKISNALDGIIEWLGKRYPCPYVDQDLWSKPGLYDIRWAWLLFCSQTIDCRGERLSPGYNVYPISVAKELLGKQKNGLAVTAQKILVKILVEIGELES